MVASAQISDFSLFNLNRFGLGLGKQVRVEGQQPADQGELGKGAQDGRRLTGKNEEVA